MVFIDPMVVQGVRILARQVTSTAASSVLSTSSPTPTPTSASSSIASTTTSATTSTDTTSTSSTSSSSSGSQNSSPLLFFVALGFGVVFTNLWIIVGVKYCFRYNARSRQLRLNEDGEPINMDQIQRPHRRRREKKLMTMDEVNEKFPMLKYKTWVASRAQEGLPTMGGVSAPPSRANSVRHVEGVISKEVDVGDERPTTSATSKTKTETEEPRHEQKDSTSSTVDVQHLASSDVQVPATAAEEEPYSKAESRNSHEEDDEDDEHIDAALPPECEGTSGDTCAICIDTLEDDDDVRGLTCGHAFHAVCLDPWLTSRRACCPLCKADYYTPKLRPPAAEPGDGTGTTTIITVSLPGRDMRSPRGVNMPNRPPQTFRNLRAQTRRILPNQFSGNQGELAASQTTGNNRNRGIMDRFRSQNVSSQRESQDQQQPGGFLGSLRSGITGLTLRRGNGQSSEPVASGANPGVTDSQLEAGVRRS